MTDLERALVTLGRELAVPDTPDLAARVLASLDRQSRRPRVRPIVVLAALVAAALLAALVIPDARSALLRFLHIGGVRIEIVDELPEVAPEPTELDLETALGRRVSLGEARDAAGFDLLELDEDPDSVYLGPRGSVWFLYGRPDAPRLLIAQTPGAGLDEPFLFKKLAAAGTSVEETTVRGRPAYLLSGEPHEVFLVDRGGAPFLETVRLARDVLVWEEGGRTIRLEGELSRDDAVAIAESLR